MRKSSVFAIGGRSSMVEPQIVVLAVAGSSPVGHPILSQVPVFRGATPAFHYPWQDPAYYDVAALHQRRIGAFSFGHEKRHSSRDTVGWQLSIPLMH